MNLDDKIKKELTQQSPDVEAIIMRDQGLFEMLFATFRSSMKGWMILINIVIFAITIAMVWCGYHFFTVAPEEQTFWGICTLMLLFVQAMSKQWIFMEMNRSSLMREIKRLELRLLRQEEQHQ